MYFGRVGLRNIAGSNSWSASEFEFTTTYKIPEVAVVGMVCFVINQKAKYVGSIPTTTQKKIIMKKFRDLIITCGVAVGIVELSNYDPVIWGATYTFALFVGVGILIKH